MTQWQIMRQAGDRLFPWLVLSALLHMVLVLGIGFRARPLPPLPAESTIEIELAPMAATKDHGTASTLPASFTRQSETSEAAPRVVTPNHPTPRAILAANEDVGQRANGNDFALALPSGQELFITAESRDPAHLRYLELWRQKVERIGNLNYPIAARDQHLSGSLVLDVSLREDGSLAGVSILRSSGIPLLDQAACRFIKMAAPFAPFPAQMRQGTTVLHIIRTLNFQGGHVR